MNRNLKTQRIVMVAEDEKKANATGLNTGKYSGKLVAKLRRSNAESPKPRTAKPRNKPRKKAPDRALSKT